MEARDGVSRRDTESARPQDAKAAERRMHAASEDELKRFSTDG